MYNFDEFKHISLLEYHIENFVDTIVEQIINIETNKINEASSDSEWGDRFKAVFSLKIPKLKKALKAYQRDLVDQALNDLDYEKRKEAAGKEDPETKDRLKVAHQTKNEQLKARAQADLEKVNDIADGNKTVEAIAKSGKIEARIKAAEIAYKHADGQEKEGLKVRIADLKDDKRQTLADIKSYKSERKEEKPANQQPTPTNNPNPNVKKSPTDEAVPKSVTKRAEDFTTIPDPNPTELQYLRDQLEDARDKWEDAKEKANDSSATEKDKLKEIDAHKKVIDAKIKLAKVKGDGAIEIAELQQQLVELENKKLQVTGGGEVLTALVNARNDAKEKYNKAKEEAAANRDNESKQQAEKRAALAYYRAEKNLAKQKGEDTKGWDDRITEYSNMLKN